MNVRIKGMGIYAPGSSITNQELKHKTKLDFDEQKLEEKIGIYSRHIAHLSGINETTADFATKAAHTAITDADIDPNDIGLFIVGTDTPEYISPSTAILIQGRIQGAERWSAAFDINSSCAGFTIAFDTAVKILSASSYQYAVVVGVYNMPAFLRPDDAFGYSIFADGAGAFVLEKTTNNSSCYISGLQLVDGTQWDFIGIYSGGSRNPITNDRLSKGNYGLENLKPLPGDRNVRLWPMVLDKMLSEENLTPENIDHFIFTQINKSVIVKVMNVINQPMEKTTCIMDRYGYTGSGCVPMAFYHAVKEGRVKRGDKVAFVASGAGLSVGANLFVY